MRRAALALLALAATAHAQGLEERVRALELRAAPGESAVDAWFDRGLRFASRDEFFTARIGLSVVQHSVLHLREGGGAGPDEFLVREAAPEFGVRIAQAFEGFVSPIVLPGSARLLYGWVEFNRWDWLRIRVGQFKEPYSLETLEETRWWDFPENSVVYMQAPVPDLGVMVHGRIHRGLLQYAIGVFNGNGALAGRDGNSDKDVAGRLIVVPSVVFDWGYDFHVQAAASATWGRQDRRASPRPFPMWDPATGTEFHSNPVTANFETERVARVSAEVAALVSFLEMKAEFSYHRSVLHFDDGARRPFRSPAFYAQLGAWIAGRRFPLGIPQVDEPLFRGGFGALQVAGRFARMRLDDLLIERAGFDGARRVDESALVVNWFPNENVRVSLKFVRVAYRHGRALLRDGTRTAREDALLLRVQLSF